MIYCNMGNIRVILWYIAKITTNFYRIGSDSPHRRRVTPLLRAIGFLRQAQRLDASGTRPPKVPLPLGAALHLMHGSLGQREPASLSAPESAHWRTQHANRQTDKQTHHATSRRMQQQPAFMLCCACMRRTLKATSCTCNPSAVGRSATQPRSISCRALTRSVHFAAIFVYRAHTKLIPFCHFTAHKTPPSRRRRKRRTGKSPHLIASYESRACGRGASS